MQKKNHKRPVYRTVSRVGREIYFPMKPGFHKETML